jgi:biopolymer transport protein ExbD
MTPETRARKRRSSRLEPCCAIDVFPLLAIFFVLFLIVLMAQPRAHGGYGPDPPRAQHATALPGAIRDDAMLLFLTRDGRLFFRTHQVVPQDLPGEIRESLQSGAERRVYLIVDEHAKYSLIATAAAQIQRTGLQNVSFVTDFASPGYLH